MKTILVTGGAGFIGSNFVRMMLEQERYRIINLDALTYAGSKDNLDGVMTHRNHIFIHGDICDRALVKEIFEKYEIDGVINFAAESHVDRSINRAEEFIRTNIMGTLVLLEEAKTHWKTEPNNPYSRQYKEGVRFLQISTDEVYGSLGESGVFTEESPLLPNSPYAASKTSADLMVRAFYHTHGMPVLITRCSNNYGKYQFPEKLIPFMVLQALQKKPLTVYGDGKQVRDWIHVDDHCDAVLTVFERGKIGEVYNIGGNNEKTNLQIVKRILQHLEMDESLICHVADRPGGDFRYAMDNAKITAELGWSPIRSFEEGLKDTVAWYRQNDEWLTRRKDRICQNYRK